MKTEALNYLAKHSMTGSYCFMLITSVLYNSLIHLIILFFS